MTYCNIKVIIQTIIHINIYTGTMPPPILQ